MAKTKKLATEVQLDRRSGKSDDRRQKQEPVAVERRKAPRRRQIDPTTCERDYSDDEIQFMHALDEYKRKNGRMFPTCSEILEVIRSLGYIKPAPPAATEPTEPTEPTAIDAAPATESPASTAPQVPALAP